VCVLNASVKQVLAMRRAALQYNDEGGYDLIRLPTGNITRVFTKQEYRLDSAGPDHWAVNPTPPHPLVARTSQIWAGLSYRKLKAATPSDGRLWSRSAKGFEGWRKGKWEGWKERGKRARGGYTIIFQDKWLMRGQEVARAQVGAKAQT
jgi:hypothetical protein